MDVIERYLVNHGLTDLLDAGQPLVIFERLAHGGGASKWYRLTTAEDLHTAAAQMRPGSLIQVFQDETMSAAPVGQIDPQALVEVARRQGEVLLGPPGTGAELLLECLDPDEVEAELSRLDSNRTVYFGAPPQVGSSGLAEINFVLPDADGVVRRHPH